VGEVVFGVTSYLDMACGSIIAIFITFPCCCVECCIALSTTFVDNVSVALSTCGGARRFLDEFQKTCVICVVLILLVTLGPIQR
jgi:hypothetical protein